MTMKLDNLLKMNRGDLLKLQEDVATALKQTEAEARKDAIARMKAIADEAGFSVTELFGAIAEKKPTKEKAPVKYRDEQGNTWAGKGKRPAWVVSFIEAGGNLDTLKV